MPGRGGRGREGKGKKLSWEKEKEGKAARSARFKLFIVPFGIPASGERDRGGGKKGRNVRRIDYTAYFF